jgi:hypothetical protein
MYEREKKKIKMLTTALRKSFIAKLLGFLV